MAKRYKKLEVDIVDEKGTFYTFFKRFSSDKEEYDFNSLSMIRSLLSNEKARVLHTIKTKKPNSIYSLAKILGRDFKSVSEDIKIFEKFGFVDLISEKTGKRERLRPVLNIDAISLEINL